MGKFLWDVIIVGGGPAGASAAFELAKLGRKVLILEAKKLPRYKACGGGIPLSFFETLPERVQKTLDTVFSDFEFYGPGNTCFKPKKFMTVAGVMRERFDHEFILAACDQGAQLVDGNPLTHLSEKEDRVVVETSQGTYEAKFLIGADGTWSLVRRLSRLPFRARLIPALEIEVPSHQKHPGGIHFGIIRDGYGWMFPKKGALSAGVISLGRDRKNLRPRLESWLSTYDLKISSGALHGYVIPFWKGRSALNTQRVLLTGDAAIVADPLTGEGIRNSIYSGRLAACFVRKSLETGKPIDGYSRAVSDEIQKDFAYARLLAWFFYRFPKMFFSKLVSHPHTFEILDRIQRGEFSYRQIFWRGLGRFLRVC